ncbi:glycosyltransferase family 4 protein [Methylicorpusculum oleiharenae]|uniref:glycosyltransferase family 4 protein n=1 Tax=Methylicorpusculum oleiharenae TaxID=1338687 RepID=UPI00135CCB14|nr:glycosyltransferase family 4 protein [Methylicorpusculum oleiharenae]MCD2451813.1 glycosyltransferase family 4 protein [Methylicorpusculum oleiharenae]
MHIGIVTSEFPPDIGGVETYAVEFAQTLVKSGHQVSVFVHTQHQIDLLRHGITLYPVLKFCRRLDRNVLKHYEVDAWHVMNAAHSWLSLETDKPVAVSIHGNDFLNPYPLTGTPALANWGPLWRCSSILDPFDRWLGKCLTPLFMRRALPKSRIILANSQYTKQVFLTNFPECNGKTLVAQVGVGDIFLSSLLTSKKNPIPQLLTVSRLSEPRKNVDRVIEALSQLNPSTDFRYTIIGDGTYRQQLEALVNNLNLENKINFMGRQPTEQVIEAMHQADLFVLPSSTLSDSHEGFGIVYLEAAACGTPSLATRQAGAIEAISDGESGFFVDDPTVDNIKNALQSFLNGQISFNNQACRAFAKQFTWHKVVEKALPFYLQEKSI